MRKESEITGLRCSSRARKVKSMTTEEREKEREREIVRDREREREKEEEEEEAGQRGGRKNQNQIKL